MTDRPRRGKVRSRRKTFLRPMAKLMQGTAAQMSEVLLDVDVD
jgi:hypothetical protein